MNIKEIEKEVGIRRANIRYYEEQGLIAPKRNSINNYRDYTKEDVLILEKIKTLRMLGVSVSEIKEVQEKRRPLDKVLSKRISEIEGERAGLKETEELCRMLQKHCLTYETLDLSFVNMRKSLSLQKGVGFMNQDRSTNYEGIYQVVSQFFTFYVFLISLPTSQLIQNLLHYNLPGWMALAGSVGLVFFGVMNLVSFLLMEHEKKMGLKESRDKFYYHQSRTSKHSGKSR